MKVEALLEAASAETERDDFGDPSFREGLEVLVDSLNGEAELSDVGRIAAEATLGSQLVNRLRVEDWWKTHPELARERVERPLIIAAISRSGTTALSHLLARDPRNRSLLQWEASSSVPPPEAATYDRDPRFLAARQVESAMDSLNPSFKAMHHDPPDLPVECLVVMAQHYVSLHFPTMFHVPAYADWVFRQDHAPVYRWHARVLRLLQSRKPGRWQLKSPHHAISMEAAGAQYPGARFVVTHRDPAVCVASTVSLVTSLTGTFSHADRRRETARNWPHYLGAMAEGLERYADVHGDDSLIHVHYPELVADPLGTVRRIYAALGEELSPEAETAMRAHVGEHPQHRHGVHRYDFESYGLSRDALDEQFAGYRKRFGVEREEQA